MRITSNLNDTFILLGTLSSCACPLVRGKGVSNSLSFYVCIQKLLGHQHLLRTCRFFCRFMHSPKKTLLGWPNPASCEMEWVKFVLV
jgi:hypothetical protein